MGLSATQAADVSFLTCATVEPLAAGANGDPSVPGGLYVFPVLLTATLLHATVADFDVCSCVLIERLGTAAALQRVIA